MATTGALMGCPPLLPKKGGPLVGGKAKTPPSESGTGAVLEGPLQPSGWSGPNVAELPPCGRLTSTARQARESNVLARLAAELAEGHASFRSSGYFTLPAPSDEELESLIDAVQHAAEAEPLGRAAAVLRPGIGTLPFRRELS
jgi:hypothetical protein